MYKDDLLTVLEDEGGLDLILTNASADDSDILYRFSSNN